MSALPQIVAVCPSCGGFGIQTPTGWCLDCTYRLGYCIECGEVNTSPRQKMCSRCREQRWREKHAERIEDYQLQGLTLTAAMAKVRIDLREERGTS